MKKKSIFPIILFVLLFLLFLPGGFAQHCTPVVIEGCSLGDDINNFSLNGEGNTSISDLNSGCSGASYVDNTNLAAVNLSKGATYTAQISSNNSFDYAAVWIDLNDNFSFDSTELVGYLGNYVSMISSDINLLIPSTATLGNHRMRILVYNPYNLSIYNNIPPTLVSPCNTGQLTYKYGETQDYLVNIVAPTTCFAPTSISSSLMANSATISWVGTGNYILEYGPSGFTPGTGALANGGTVITSSSNSITVTGLTTLSSYDFYIRQDCSMTGTGYSNNISLINVVPGAPPVNDLCSSAIPLTSDPIGGPTSGTTSGATVSGDAASCEVDSNYGDVWFSFQASHANQYVTVENVVTTDGAQSERDFGLSAYSGSCGALTNLGCSLGIVYAGGSIGSDLYLQGLTIGQTYYLRFWKDGTSGFVDSPINGDLNFKISVINADPPPPPANDSCINAINLPVTNGFAPHLIVGTTISATDNGDVWFSVTVPPSGNITIKSFVVANGEAENMTMEAYSGTCSALTFLTSNNGDYEYYGQAHVTPKITLTGKTPGAIIYIRMRPSNSDEYGRFGIAAFDVTNLPPVTSLGNCIEAPSITINESKGNLYRWVPFLDTNGNIIAELYADGNVLGPTEVSTYINSDSLRQNNGHYYLDRNITITPTIQPSSNIQVRVYSTGQEMTNLQSKNSALYNISNLHVFKNEDSCSANVNNLMSENMQALGLGNYNYINRYLQFNTSSFSSFFFSASSIPLSIEIKTINARNMGASNQILWSTEIETVGNYFELERSVDGKDFKFVDKIMEKGIEYHYIYNDLNPPVGINYYRLKLIGEDGRVSYSETVQAFVKPDGKISLQAYPNPTRKNITLRVSGSQNGIVKLIDITGRIVYTSPMVGSEMMIDMSSLVNGFYLLHYVDDAANNVIKINKQ